MSDINVAFLEEFKRLDNLCRTAFATEKGVTTYIDTMKAAPLSAFAGIDGWDSTLRTLIKLRSVRNKLSHEVGSMDGDLCTDADIDWLSQFYLKIKSKSDPISIMYNGRKTEKPKNSPAKISNKPKDETQEMPQKKPSQSNGFGSAFLWIVVILFFIFVIGYKLIK